MKISFAFVSTIMYTVSATIFHSKYEQHADDFDQGTPPESLTVSASNKTQKNSFRGDESSGTYGGAHSNKKEAQNTEATERGITPRSSRGGCPYSKREILHNGRASKTSTSGCIVLRWTSKAEKEMTGLPADISNRVATKMQWFVIQKNPLYFAATLRGSYKGFWRFRIGDYRAICKFRKNVLFVSSVKHRKDIYRGAL